MQMLNQQVLDLPHQGRRKVLARGHKVHHFAKNPGAPLRGAANHDRIGLGGCQHFQGFFGRVNIPISHHGHAHRRFDGCDGVVLSKPLVTLFAGAPVHGDHLHTCLLGRTRDHHRIFLGLAPAGTHFERDWHTARGRYRHHGFNDAQGEGFVLHQS